MGIVGLRQGQVGHVGVEAPAAVGTAVFGIGDHDADRPAGAGIAQVMEGSSTLVAARGRAAAARALAAAEVSTPVLEMRGREILHPGGPFSGICDVVAWSIHDPFLRTKCSSEGSSTPDWAIFSTTLLLQSPKAWSSDVNNTQRGSLHGNEPRQHRGILGRKSGRHPSGVSVQRAGHEPLAGSEEEEARDPATSNIHPLRIDLHP